MAFTDSYKHMECLGGMRLHFFILCLPMQRRVPQLVGNKVESESEEVSG